MTPGPAAVVAWTSNPHRPNPHPCGRAVAGCNGTARVTVTLTSDAGSDSDDTLCSLCASDVVMRLRPGWTLTIRRPVIGGHNA